MWETLRKEEVERKLGTKGYFCEKAEKTHLFFFGF